MEQVSTVKFRFMSKIIDVKVTLEDFRALPDNIIFPLINEPHIYNIQADVSEDVFNSLCIYFATHTLPNIQISNFFSYVQINNEFCIQSITELIEEKRDSFGEYLLNIESIYNQSIPDKSQIEEEIAQNLDIYINKYGEQLLNLPINSLFNIFGHKNMQIKSHNELYELIKNYYNKTNNFSVFSLLPFVDARELTYENKLESIDQYCSHGNFFPSFAFSSIIADFHELKRCQKRYYEMIKMVTESQNCSFNDINIKCNVIRITRKLLKICGSDDIKNALEFKIKKTEIDEGLTFELDDFQMTAEIVDSKAKEEIVIPHFVCFESKKYIIKSFEKSAFSSYGIKSINFPNDSEVRVFECKSIGSNSLSSIEYIKIPASVEELKEGWCCCLEKLVKVEISPDNQHFKMNENKCIIGKTKKEQENFDKLIFAVRDIEEITIPSYITQIGSYCFENCTKLTKITYQDDNQIQSIGKRSFSSTSIKHIKIPSNITIIEEETFSNSLIESITIPSNVTIINEKAFYQCSKLTTIEIPSDSKLQTIGNYAFSSTSIESIKIPSNVNIIGKFAFLDCSKLSIIDIPSDSKIQTIGNYAFSPSDHINDLYNLNNHDKISFLNEAKIAAIRSFGVPSRNNFIEKLAFYSSSIETIKIPFNIIKIDDFAFAGCSNLSKVEIQPNSQLKTIGKYAFSSSSIESLIIPINVTTIEEGAFNDCKKLSTIIIANDHKLQVIGKKAFSFSSIKNFVLSSNVEVIGEETFRNCEKLTIFEIPSDSKLQNIGKNSFSYSSIQSIRIPSNVINIEECTFNYCSKLSTIEFDSGSKLQRICESSFSRSIIVSIKIPSEVVVIEDHAFYDCKNLFAVDITSDSKLQIIGKYAFNATSIKSITIPPNITEIKEGAFRYCGELSFITMHPYSKLLKIEKDAFNTSQIKYIKIPASVEELKEGWCCCLEKLVKVEISPDNQHFKMNENKCIIGKTKKEQENFDKLIFAVRDIEEITIPSYITQIGSYCFENCTKLTKITYQDDNQIQSIGKRSFSSTSIKHIKIPSNITIIEEETFSNSLIESITIPSNVTIINEKAFYQCSKLTTIEIPSDSKLQTIGNYAFSSTSIESIKIPSNVNIIDKYAFHLCNNLTTIDIPSDSKLQAIYKDTFSCSSIKSIKIPSNITTIEEQAFYKCSELTEIEIPPDSKLQTICKNAFTSSSIKSIKFNSSLKLIEEYAFYECKNLKKIEFPNNSALQSFSPYVFSCTSIDQITIPPLIEQIHISSFKGCEKLKKVSYSSDAQFQKIGKDPFKYLNEEIIYDHK